MTQLEAIRSRADPALRARFRACLMAGAAGDALGAAVEFMSEAVIHARFGPEGIRDFAEAYGRIGAITDDTRMTLFTAAGLMRARVRWSEKGICHVSGVIDHAYLRWLKTQGISHPLQRDPPDGWLVGNPALHAQRAPGRTCITALPEKPHFGPAATDRIVHLACEPAPHHPTRTAFPTPSAKAGPPKKPSPLALRHAGRARSGTGRHPGREPRRRQRFHRRHRRQPARRNA